MATDGVGRLLGGVVRRLNQSEVSRGYIFITKDKRIPEILDPTNFELVFLKKRIKGKRLDVSGRVFMGKRELAAIGTTTPLSFRLRKNGVLLIDVA